MMSLSSVPPSDEEIDDVRDVLTPEEYGLWSRQNVRDQRHSIHIWRRFVVLHPSANVEEERAALLHDIGKIASGLGTFGRIAATIVGPRIGRFRTYHDHSRIGAEMLREVSSPRTIELVSGRDDEVGRRLRAADEI